MLLPTIYVLIVLAWNPPCATSAPIAECQGLRALTIQQPRVFATPQECEVAKAEASHKKGVDFAECYLGAESPDITLVGKMP